MQQDITEQQQCLSSLDQEQGASSWLITQPSYNVPSTYSYRAILVEMSHTIIGPK